MLMGAKFVFTLKTDAKRRQLPYKILLAQQENETTNHILLKVIAYLLLFRERIEIEGKLHNENIPFSPDIVQLDYELRPRLWVECGECSDSKLNKLAYRMLLACRNYEIFGFRLLQHKPLHFDVIPRMPPVASCLQIAQIQTILKA